MCVIRKIVLFGKLVYLYIVVIVTTLRRYRRQCNLELTLAVPRLDNSLGFRKLFLGGQWVCKLLLKFFRYAFSQIRNCIKKVLVKAGG